MTYVLLCWTIHVLDNPSCPCGSENEDIFHYFYVCPLYTNQRQIMLQTISNFNITDCQMLLHGNINLDLNGNKQLFEAVHNYIESTARLWFCKPSALCCRGTMWDGGVCRHFFHLSSFLIIIICILMLYTFVLLYLERVYVAL